MKEMLAWTSSRPDLLLISEMPPHCEPGVARFVSSSNTALSILLYKDYIQLNTYSEEGLAGLKGTTSVSMTSLLGSGSSFFLGSLFLVTFLGRSDLGLLIGLGSVMVRGLLIFLFPTVFHPSSSSGLYSCFKVTVSLMEDFFLIFLTGVARSTELFRCSFFLRDEAAPEVVDKL